MGTYVSIRGWIECTEEQLPRIKSIIASFVDKAEYYRLESGKAEMYNQGWVIPETHINWTHYIFYGADIRIQYLSYIRDQLNTLTKEVTRLSGDDTEYLNGVFHIGHEEGYEIYIWKLSNGNFHEEQITK